MNDFKLHPRFSSFLIRFVAVAGLAASLFVGPARLRAQQPAPTTTSAPGGQNAVAPTDSESANLDTDEEKKSRALLLEGPVVKWVAKTLNAPKAVVAVAFEVFNFLIIVLGIGVPLVRWLPRFFRNRKEKLRGDIENARKVTEDANARLSAVEAKLASLDQEIQKFRAEVESESLQDEKRIKESFTEESARIVQAAEQEIGQAAAQARRELRSFAAGLAIDKAVREMKLTAETDRALIAEFVGDMVRSAGEKN